MAKKGLIARVFKRKAKKKGKAAKTKMSNHKHSKHYSKAYRGQGR